MANNDTVDVARGAARDFLFQARDSTGTAFAPSSNPSPFLITDTLTARVWAGDEAAVLLSLPASWSDVTTGLILVPLSNANTATLPLGNYGLQVWATRGGKSAPVVNARLRITPTSGTQTFALAYTTADDLIRYAPWLEDLQDDRQTAGYLGEQARATEDLIAALVRMYQPGGWGSAGDAGFMARASYGGGGGNVPSKWLRDQITPVAVDAGHPANPGNPAVYSALLIREQTKEICARRAISYVCDSQLARDDKDAYRRMGRTMRVESNNLMLTYTAEIDLSIPQTGYASITISAGASSLR